MCLQKYAAIFLFLAVFVLIFVLRYMVVLEWFEVDRGQLEPAKEDSASKGISHNSTIIAPRVSTDPDVHHKFCTSQLLSPEDALEERLLLDSIAWPKTSLNFSLNQTSDPAHGSFTILPGRGGGQWQVGDQLEVMINMFDFQGHPKKSGGDVLLARLHNPRLVAGVTGQVVDHLNGSYSAVFPLLWEGSAQVQVLLVHPSEAVTVLTRLTSEQPDRIYFKSVFRSGSVSETAICNVCLRPTQQLLCNYTDLHTGEPWFCYKPKNLSCDARISHYMGGVRQNPKDEKLFQSGVNMKVYIRASGPAGVIVLPKKQGQPEVKSNSTKSGPSGYYYQGVWRALGGTTVFQFNNSSAIIQCLKCKMVHMYGDSTVRQWFEYLNAALPDLKQFDLHSSRKFGPFMAVDNANNILVTYRFHGNPIRIGNIPASELRLIANELDALPGGTNTVVVFGIWAHFGSYPIEIYIRRLQGIRRAVVRLLDRAPDTLVIIRTGNPKHLTFDVALLNSDWYSLQCDKVLRTMFKGLNVHLVDAWEMTLAHHLPHNLHPQPPIIKNMINVILSYICPQKGN